MTLDLAARRAVTEATLQKTTQELISPGFTSYALADSLARSATIEAVRIDSRPNKGIGRTPNPAKYITPTKNCAST